jgi:hypothetical protein
MKDQNTHNTQPATDLPGAITTDITDADIFKAGIAWISFRMNEGDQGIHTILPCTDGTNKAFQSLFDSLSWKQAKSCDELSHLLAIWLDFNGIDIGQIYTDSAIYTYHKETKA